MNESFNMCRNWHIVQIVQKLTYCLSAKVGPTAETNAINKMIGGVEVKTNSQTALIHPIKIPVEMEVSPRHKLLSPLNIIYNIFKMIAGEEVKTHTALSHPLNLTLLGDWSQNQRPTQI